jgi:hypothetical protein
MNDCLVRLEHERTRDRMRKIMFDRIESITVWRKLPVARMLVLGLLIALPSALVLFIQETVSTIIGGSLLALAVCVISWYGYCGYITIRIVRLGKTYDLAGIYRPGRLRSFLERLMAGIRAAQQNVVASQTQEPEPQVDETTPAQPPLTIQNVQAPMTNEIPMTNDQ